MTLGFKWLLGSAFLPQRRTQLPPGFSLAHASYTSQYAKNYRAGIGHPDDTWGRGGTEPFIFKSALDAGKRLTSLNRRLGGLKNSSGPFREDAKSLLLPESNFSQGAPSTAWSLDRLRYPTLRKKRKQHFGRNVRDLLCPSWYSLESRKATHFWCNQMLGRVLEICWSDFTAKPTSRKLLTVLNILTLI